MKVLKKGALAAILFVIATAMTSFAQGPLQKRVNYSINVPYALRMGDYILPPGKYVLYQINQDDLNLFALYKKNRMRPPIAMIRTTRIDYQPGEYPEKTKILLTIDEERKGRDNLPLLKGWTIPGMDGWEIIGVVEKEKGALARAQ